MRLTGVLQTRRHIGRMAPIRSTGFYFQLRVRDLHSCNVLRLVLMESYVQKALFMLSGEESFVTYFIRLNFVKIDLVGLSREGFV